ncbi:MAG TPA: AMP-binding protein [Rhodanobacteraceae bacterium]|nr:AMP-binding protein [Rhodanobacteraceae bacterium]
MAVVFDNISSPEIPAVAPLPCAADPERVIAWRNGRAVRVAEFLAEVQALANLLPQAEAAVNLCEDRYAFLVAFAALALRGQTNLLPPSRAPHAVDEVLAAHSGSYSLGDVALDPPPPHYLKFDPQDLLHARFHEREDQKAGFAIRAVQHAIIPDREDQEADILVRTSQNSGLAVDPGLVVAIGYTSGSTGIPKANPKRWDKLAISNKHNDALLRSLAGGAYTVVATVPPQHMYGLEFSVLLPLLSDVAVHAAKPFFPCDIAQALAEIPAPRVLVTTPVHLRALVEESLRLPPLAAIISATAPMPPELARAAEDLFATPVQEVFGSTETCVVAHRRTASEECFTLYPGIALHPQPGGAQVDAPQLRQPVALADLVELVDGNRFRLCGRNADLLEIAGKRASLGDLTRKLLGVPGVRDGVVLQLDECNSSGVRRIAALAVAPGMTSADILAELRRAIDPVFLPRRLKLVEALPRSDTGKLPRAAMLELLRS